MHDVGLAVEEVRFSVEELGAIGVVGNPNPVNSRHIHDPYFDPLWDTLEGLGVPLDLHPTGLTSLRDNINARFVDTPMVMLLGDRHTTLSNSC